MEAITQDFVQPKDHLVCAEQFRNIAYLGVGGGDNIIRKNLFAGTVPANKNLFAGTPSVGYLNIFHHKNGFIGQKK